MSKRYGGRYNGWDVFGAVIGVLVAIAVIFCVVVCVMASTHGVTFQQEIISWFDKAPEVGEVAEETLSLIFRK